MKFKKLLSVLLAIVMAFSAFGVTSYAAEDNYPIVAEETAENGIFSGVLDFFSDIISSILDLFTPQKELPDVSEWTEEDIVAYYKKAASKSAWRLAGERTLDTKFVNDSVESNDELSQLLYDSVSAYIPTKFRGVMGDYRKLTVDDCKSAKAYADGEYLVIEIAFKDEIDSMHDENDVVTASHGMKLLENSDAQWTNIRLMGLYGQVYDLSEGDLLMKYTDAKAKVKINKRGAVEEGEWSFGATMTFRNVKITLESYDYSYIMDGTTIQYKSTMVV